MAMRPALWLPNSKLRAIEERLDANNGVPQTAEEYIVSVRSASVWLMQYLVLCNEVLSWLLAHCQSSYVKAAIVDT